MMRCKLISNIEYRISNIGLCIIASLIAICLPLVLPSATVAQDKDKDQTIMSPHDFIEKNLKEFNERLRRLKELYQDQYGSLFAATSPVDVESIAKELPKPKTLRLAIQYPEKKVEEEKKPVIEKGDYFLDNPYGSATVDPMYQLTEGYYTGKGESEMLVAADVQTSQFLGLPQKVDLSLNAAIHYVSKENTSTTGGYGEVCCTSVGREQYCAETSSSYPYRCIRTAYNEFCFPYAQIPLTGYVWSDPRLYGNELNLRVAGVKGASMDEKMKTVTFSSPGKKAISFISPRKYSSEEQYRVYRSCIAKYSYRQYGGYYGYSTTSFGLDKAVIGYKPAGEVSKDFVFTAVAFKKFGFPGYDMNVSDAKPAELDYFFDSKTAGDSYSYYGSRSGRLEPYVLLDYGDVGGLKAVKASDIRAPVTWSIVKPGPFTIEDWNISYMGGIGETKFRVTLGGYESVERSITANIVDIVLDDAMSRNEVSPGKNHKALVRVKGPADMSRYQVKWSGEGGAWAQSVTPFKKVGETWQAEGLFSVGFDGIFDPSKLKKPVKIAVEVTRVADNSKIYTYENSRLSTTYPAIDKLELFAGIGRSTPQKVTEPIDLFVSFDTPKVVLLPKLSFKGDKVYSMSEVCPNANIEVVSDKPSVVYVKSEKVVLLTGRELNASNIVANAGEKTGTAKVTARLGGKDLDPAGYAQIAGDKNELKSDPVEITVNTAFLLAESASGGRTSYKIMVIGPADMTKYQAIWTGEATRTTPFKREAGSYISTLDTTLRMDRVALQKAGTTLAQWDVKNTVRKLNVKLIPPKPPVTVVNKVSVSDLGSLETITECKKTVSRQIELFGFNPGMAVDDYCKAEREKQKQEIKAEREDQKAFNKMLSNLNSQGQDLVVVSDTMRVGAAVKGDITTMGSDLVCFWSLQNKANLELQSTVTPIESVGQNEGACFNIIRGLKGGFNPDTVIKVDLVILPRPEVPVVATGGKVVIYGNMLIR